MQIPNVLKRNSHLLVRAGGLAIVGLFIVGVAWTGAHKQHGSGAQSCGACIAVVSSPEVHSTYHVYLSSVAGGDAGSRTTPYTMASTANYTLIFESTAAGYAFDHWYIGYNKTTNPNRSISFSGNTYANSTIIIVLKNTAPPGSFDISSISQTTSSINVTWGPASGATSYDFKRGSTPIALNYPNNSYNDSGLSCGTAYLYTVTAKNNVGSTTASKSLSTSACPAPPPASSGGSAGSGSKTTSTPAAPKLQGSSNTATPAPSDTTPPNKPDGFTASLDENTAAVALKWNASIDASGIKAYQLDRSTDQQNWQTLTSDSTDTSYLDTTPSFSTHYFYRVRATDNAGNASEFATTDTTTQAFAVNTRTDQDSTVSDDSHNLSVTIPAGALAEAAQCAVVAEPTILPPSLKNYKAIDGPYKLICKNLTGAEISPTKPFSIAWTTSATARAGIKTLEYFGYKDNNWQALKVKSRDQKNRTDQVAVEGASVFTAMGKLKHTPLLVKILLVVLVLAAVGALVFFGLVLRLRRQQQSRYDDYIHKEFGI